MFLARRSRLTLDDALELVPARAPHVETVERGEELQLVVRRSPTPLARILAHFFTLPPSRSFVLDRFGVRVWMRCDGRARVRDVAAELAAEEGWPPDRAQQAVVAFLAGLSSRRLVAFSGPAGAR